MKSAVIDRLTGTAGLGGSLGTSPSPLVTLINAECTCPISAGKSADATELLLTYDETIDAVSSIKVPIDALSLIYAIPAEFDFMPALQSA